MSKGPLGALLISEAKLPPQVKVRISISNRHRPVAQLPLGRTGPFSIHVSPTLPIPQTAPVLYSSLHKYPEPLAFWEADLTRVLPSLGCLVNNPPCIANVTVSDFWLDAHGAK